MKKIYLSIASLATIFSASAQFSPKVPTIQRNKAIMYQGTEYPKSKTNASLNRTSAAAFAIQLDPVFEVMKQKGIILPANPMPPGAQIGQFLFDVYQDSTVTVASDQIRTVGAALLGSVLDPKSSFVQDTYVPIVTQTEGYNVDSIFILGSYVKKTADIDTLYVWLVWGDSTNTLVFNKRSSVGAWSPPIDGFRTSVIGPKLTGFSGLPGNTIKAAAPATNKKLVKYVLQSQDSTGRGYGYSKQISISLTDVSPTGVAIPAGNIVSCFYTFVPGGTHTLGQPMYSFTNTVVPTINGFCALGWQQISPAINSVNDYQSYMVDNTGWNMGLSYDQNTRHGKYGATWGNFAVGDLVSAPRLFYSITNESISTRLQESVTKGFSLGQNTPNPYNGSSVVPYSLAKDAAYVLFTVTDIMGRVITSEKANTTTGSHSVKLGTYPAGIYYYSLNVDGKSTTHKMIVE